MINDLLQRLMSAQTDEERSWIATESLLESLPKDVKSALWAVAIPHWFDAEILAALCPELADRAEEIYRQLQTISCVEVFPERGHNVHELTRNQLLDRLCKDNPDRFRELSDRAAVYFAQTNRPENQIEWIYQLAVANPDRCINELSDLANAWQNAFRRAELDSLIAFLRIQIQANRTTIAVKAETIYWDGKIKFRFYQAKEALERYEAAMAFYREIGARLGEANTLQAIGDVLQFLDRRTEALERYEAALAFYREIGDRLGEANVLQELAKSQSDPRQGLEALQIVQEIYEQIGDKYSQSRNLLFFISERQIKCGEIDAAILSLRQAEAIAIEIDYEPFVNRASRQISQLTSGFMGGFMTFIRFAQTGWVQFGLCFLLGLIAFPFLLIAAAAIVLWRIFQALTKR